MDEDTGSGSIPGILLPIGPIMLVVIVFLILRSRRQSREDRAYSRIVNTIDNSDLPDRAKEILRRSVDEVRGAMTTVREMASDIRSD